MRLSAFTGMRDPDLLIERCGAEALRLVDLLAELPDEDRWFVEISWHVRGKRTSIVATLVDVVAGCAEDPSREIGGELAYAIRSVGERVIARRIESEAAAIAARAQTEVERVAARVRGELGL